MVEKDVDDGDAVDGAGEEYVGITTSAWTASDRICCRAMLSKLSSSTTSAVTAASDELSTSWTAAVDVLMTLSSSLSLSNGST